MTHADDGLRALLRRHLPPPEWEWTPVETGATVSGVPDSHWCHRTRHLSGWVEHKATDGWAVEVRPHQVGWARRHAAAGVRVVFAVRARGVGSSGGAGDSLWLVRGSAAPELQELGLRLPEWAVLGVWRGTPRSWDWGAVARILLAAPEGVCGVCGAERSA